MKRLLSVFFVILLLFGCGASDSTMGQVLQLRSGIDNGGCAFTAKITADYGDVLHSFSLDCRYETSGKLSFCVVEPESISGITGSISSGGGQLTFDDTVLAFDWMADGQLSPVCAPWVIMKALHSGYIISTGEEAGHIRSTIRDSYADDALTTDIWITMEKIPVRGEILFENRRILTVEIINFTLL